MGGVGGYLGGVGGDVLIDGSGDVYTEGDASEGIFAQSIGGGGGNGGASLAVTLSLGNASNATNASYALAVGGEGGSGNFGGTVTVDRGGQVETKGDGSHGIFAQSVGGGGGTEPPGGGGPASTPEALLPPPPPPQATRRPIRPANNQLRMCVAIDSLSRVLLPAIND